jgi:hypothetical protein
MEVSDMTKSDTIRYFEPTYEAGRSFVQRGIEGRVVMLNLLRFRQVADYSASPELAPAGAISGAQAFHSTSAIRCRFCRRAVAISSSLALVAPS